MRHLWVRLCYIYRLYKYANRKYKGQRLNYARAMLGAFFKMMNNESLNAEEEELLNDATLLEMTAMTASTYKMCNT